MDLPRTHTLTHLSASALRSTLGTVVGIGIDGTAATAETSETGMISIVVGCSLVHEDR